ncbi:hypothetical protein [Alteromonas salexigens]|uniref:hypothetical protein n=1 Tax=Alteromonas salexigens TaxID=2982530 RepID=UPI003570ABCB
MAAIARKPRCDSCIIEDLCEFKAKPTNNCATYPVLGHPQGITYKARRASRKKNTIR